MERLPLELTYTVAKPFFTDPEQAYVELPPYFETDPRNGTSSRSVLVHAEGFVPSYRGREHEIPFEAVEFTLYGAIRSQVRNRAVAEKILHVTELRKWSDFQPNQRGKNPASCSLGRRYYCDLVFPIDQSLDSRSPSKRPRLLPSLDIRSSKYVTRHTALNDQYLLTGRCEVVYCIEARLIFAEGRSRYSSVARTTDITSQLARSSIINLQPIPSSIRLSLPRKLLKDEDGSLEVEAEVKSSNILRMRKQYQSLLSGASRKNQLQPKIHFNIQQSLAKACMMSTSSASTSIFTIPVTLTVSIPSILTPITADSAVGALRRHLSGSGFPNIITVASTWHTKYTFTTTPDCSSDLENTIDASMIRSESQILKFPPFYEISRDNYTATADLELPVLAGLPATSTEGLLRIQHFLSLALEIGEETADSQVSSNSRLESLVGKTANFRLEVMVDV